jgi:hypothetical protein
MARKGKGVIGVEPRIQGINPDEADERVQAVFERQQRRWGRTYISTAIYARRPTIFAGTQAMWAGLVGSGLLDGRLVALLNRRVAMHNGCVF